MTKVSIVIPCYNVAEFLAETLQGVAEQTHQDIELICINDGSTDTTLDILKQWQSSHPSMKLIDQENAGSNAARNVGVANATGDYIQFLDADDRLEADKIAHQIKLASQKEQPSLIIGSYRKIDEAGDLVYEKSYEEQAYDVWLKLMRTDLGITSSNLFKREDVINAGKWNEDLKSSQEYDLMFRMLKRRGEVSFSRPVHTSVLQRTSGSITSTKKGENWKRYINLRLAIRQFILDEKLPIDKQAMDQVVFDAIRMLYPYNATEAKQMFKEHLGTSFHPGQSAMTSNGYLKLFRLFGFSGAERLRSFLR